MYRKRLKKEETINKEEYLTLNAKEQYKLINATIDLMEIATRRSIDKWSDKWWRDRKEM